MPRSGGGRSGGGGRRSAGGGGSRQMSTQPIPKPIQPPPKPTGPTKSQPVQKPPDSRLVASL